MNVRRKPWFRLTTGVLVCLACAACPGVFGQRLPRVSASRKARVPFVGCASDGQMGAVEAPSGKSRILPLRAGVAGQLAYYKAEHGVGVLAPRHWYCFGTYGSNGSTLYVSPEPINSANLFSTTWAGFSGQAIQLSVLDGDTSGRLGVAKVIARVFPTRRSFVSKVVAEGIEPLASFPSGPYPDDRLTYKSNDVVEFETPGQKDGLGTASRLQKNEDPIRGVAILRGQAPDLVQAFIRLTGDPSHLSFLIVRQLERETVHTHAAE